MKTTETVVTEFDRDGRVTRRTRTVEISDDRYNRGYDNATLRGATDRVHECSLKQIFDAYRDYKESQQW